MVNKTGYLKKESTTSQTTRIEVWFAPVLVIAPVIVSLVLLNDWLYRGFSLGVSDYDGELLLALIILIGNMIFDIPFIKSLINLNKI